MKYEELKRWIMGHPSRWMRENGISTARLDEIYKDEQIALWKITQSNDGGGLIIAFKTSAKDVDDWLCWMPTMEQLDFLKRNLTPIYANIKKFWENKTR